MKLEVWILAKENIRDIYSHRLTTLEKKYLNLIIKKSFTPIKDCYVIYDFDKNFIKGFDHEDERKAFIEGVAYAVESYTNLSFDRRRIMSPVEFENHIKELNHQLELEK